MIEKPKGAYRRSGSLHKPPVREATLSPYLVTFWKDVAPSRKCTLIFASVRQPSSRIFDTRNEIGPSFFTVLVFFEWVRSSAQQEERAASASLYVFTWEKRISVAKIKIVNEQKSSRHSLSCLWLVFTQVASYPLQWFPPSELALIYGLTFSILRWQQEDKWMKFVTVAETVHAYA